MSTRRLAMLMLPLVCAANANAQKMYFSTGEENWFHRANLNGTNLEHISSPMPFAWDFQLHAPTETMYLSNGGFYTATIEMQDPVPLWEGEIVYSIAVDIANEVVFWSTGQSGLQQVSRADIDGSNIEVIASSNTVFELAVAPLIGRLFIGQVGALRAMDYDGGNEETISSGHRTVGMAIDSIAGKIYFIEGPVTGLDIYRMNLDGTASELLVEDGYATDIQLDVANNRMYWTRSNAILSADLDGANPTTLLSGLVNAKILVLDLRPSLCSGNGTLGGDGCICDPGWSGNDCSCAIAACPANCSGHGSCTCGICECDTGWTGPDCACPIDAQCPLDCSGHGDCECGACFCDAGFMGLDCSIEVEERVRVFMAPDGQEGYVARTGNTLMVMEPDSTARVMLWVEDTRYAPDLSFYQLIHPWAATPYKSAQGTVEYVDDGIGAGAGGSIHLDTTREDFVFRNGPHDIPFYGEWPPPGGDGAGFGTIMTHLTLADGTTVRGTRYLHEFEVYASPDASGYFEMSLVPPSGDPAGGSGMGITGGLQAYPVDEFQNLWIVVDPSDGLLFMTESDPPSLAVDARRLAQLDDEDPGSWSIVGTTFFGDGSALDANDFSIRSSDDEPPGVLDVIPGPAGATLVLDAPVAAGQCLTVEHLSSGTSTRISLLPGDINGDAVTSPLDILRLVEHFNGVGTPLEPWGCDVNRSGTCEPRDILALIDLLNGADGQPSWNGIGLPTCP
jgi:hypothetical protein